MSLSACLEAVRDHLRKEVPLRNKECDIEGSGEPTQGTGQFYVAIHPTSWGPPGGGGGLPHPTDYGLREVYGLSCTISRRTSKSPPGSVTPNFFLNSTKSMEKLARKIMVLIHQNYQLLQRINELADDWDQMATPLQWVGTDAAPTPRGQEWFSEDSPNAPSQTGLSLEVRFASAERIQSYENLEVKLQ